MHQDSYCCQLWEYLDQWVLKAASSRSRREPVLESESEEDESNVELESESDPEIVVEVAEYPSDCQWLVGCR